MEDSIGAASTADLRASLLDNPFAQMLFNDGAARGKPGFAAAGRSGTSKARAAAAPQSVGVASDDGPSRRPERPKGFALETEGGEPLVCGDIRGFREAVVAAFDPRAPMPPRLILVAPEGGMCAWLEGWAEDSERVRRTVTICRRFDGKSITVIATLSSFGYGVETTLSVDSVFAPKHGGAVTLRSGVHSKADVEAALARFDAEAPELDVAGEPE